MNYESILNHYEENKVKLEELNESELIALLKDIVKYLDCNGENEHTIDRKSKPLTDEQFDNLVNFTVSFTDDSKLSLSFIKSIGLTFLCREKDYLFDPRIKGFITEKGTFLLKPDKKTISELINLKE